MLTFRHIILWERLAHRPFSKFNGGELDDVTMLMYCCDDKRQRDYSLSVYQAACGNTKELGKFATMITKELSFIGQFSDDGDHSAKVSKKEEVCFTDIFQMLVFRGRLDAEWLLGQSLELLSVLVKGMENSYHDYMSDKKFWTLLSMSPHMDRNSQHRLRDSLLFDWEKPKVNKLTEEQEMALGPSVFKMWTNNKKENNDSKTM